MFLSITWPLLALAAVLQIVSCKSSTSNPNVVVIMTDDQDMLLDSLSVQPNIKNLIGAQGVQYNKHYCTVSWCCPSRVSFLTGRAAHNTNVTGLSPPYGGYPKFIDQNLNADYLPVWINGAGIRTYYLGKLMNSLTDHNYNDPYPAAWTHSSFLVDPYTYQYFSSRWTNDESGEITPFYGIHTTNVTQKKALAYIDDAAEAGEQFFMMIAPVAPHVQTRNGSRGPPPQPEWANAFKDRVTPRTANFNPDEPSGASWVYNLNQLDAKGVAKADKEFVDRLENLAGIDVMVAEIIQKLDDQGLLDNTYIIYTTDNGFHIGNHRLTPGKRCGYEEDINIPLLIRGPDVATNVMSGEFHSHTDMAPTILQMLGVPLRDNFDGQPIPYTSAQLSAADQNPNEYVNVEFWDADETHHQMDGGSEPNGAYYNNTYKSLRLQSGGYSFYYSVWCDGSHELYNMLNDSQQLNNLVGSGSNINQYRFFDRSGSELVTRLDALLLVLKGCAQDSCRKPYSVLFPEGQVTTLSGAMSYRYDEFFNNQPKVSFSSCVPGNIVSEEGPQDANVYR